MIVCAWSAVLLYFAFRVLLRARVLGWMGEAITRWQLWRMRLPSLHNVVLPDRLGMTEIDHLALTPFGIAVIETKHWMVGTLDFAEDGGGWELRLGSKRLPVPNALAQNYRHVRAVYEATGLARDVAGFVVMTGPALLAERLRNEVLRSTDLRHAILPAVPPAPSQERLKAAWRHLEEVARSTERLRWLHRRELRDRFEMPVNRTMRLLAWLFLAVGCPTLVWGCCLMSE